MIGRVREYYARHPAALDLTLIAIVTLAAAVLRLVLLGDLPYGVHPDEAQLGTDGRKILDGDLWTPYTKAVLGQPSGHAYLTLPSFLLLGRLPLALVALAAIPLLYVFARQACGRAEAFFAAAMLAVSYWHLMYSRAAHWSISYGTVTLAVLLCVMLGVNTRKRGWFAGAGVIFGLGFYTYNLYPIAIAAIGVFLLLLTFMRFRGEDWLWWRGSMLVFGGVGLIVALPMLIYFLAFAGMVTHRGLWKFNRWFVVTRTPSTGSTSGTTRRWVSGRRRNTRTRTSPGRPSSSGGR